jgi:DNA invertase Pin-like site-specific DNA recombinase
MKRVAIYLRVSTDRQAVENQEMALREIAARRGWQVVEIYSDVGISGAKGRDKRPGLDRMLNDAQKGKFDVVMAWAIDRVGRSLFDLLGIIQHLEACRADLYLDQQNIDTTMPMGKLIFQVTGAFAEFERSMIEQRVHAGLARAKKAGKVLGRPTLDPTIKARIIDMRAHGAKIRDIAVACKVGIGTVHRIARQVSA